MKRWLAVLILSFGTRCLAQVAALPIQECVNSATQASLSGMQSTNYLVGAIPSCTVTIYLTGTTTLATYYFTPIGTPNTGPFTASSTGQWLAYVSPSQGYDVVLSGGIPPNTYTSPWTFTDVTVGSGGGGGSGTVGAGVANQIPVYTGTTTVAGDAQFDDDLTLAHWLTYSDTGGVQAGSFRDLYQGVYAWYSASSYTGTVDTGLSRDSSGVVDVGNGSQGDKSGTLNAANSNFSVTVKAGTSATFSSSTGAPFQLGALGYTDTGNMAIYQGSLNSYLQVLCQNSSAGTSASCDYVTNDSASTETTGFGDFGQNGTNFSGSGNLTGLAGEVYLYAQGEPLGFGTTTANPFYIDYNATDYIVGDSTGLRFPQLASYPVLSTSATGLATSANANNLSTPTLCIAASGSGTAYTCTTSPSFTVVDGTTLTFKPDVTSTANVTLAVNGGAARSVVQQQNNTQLTVNDLQAGWWVTLTYSSSSSVWLAGPNFGTSSGKINGGSVPQNALILGTSSATNPTLQTSLSNTTPGNTLVGLVGPTGFASTGCTAISGVTVSGGTPTTTLVIAFYGTPNNPIFYPSTLGVYTGGTLPSLTVNATGCTITPTLTAGFQSNYVLQTSPGANPSALAVTPGSGYGGPINQFYGYSYWQGMYNPTVYPLPYSGSNISTFSMNGGGNTCTFTKSVSQGVYTSCSWAISSGVGTGTILNAASSTPITFGEVGYNTSAFISSSPTMLGVPTPLPVGFSASMSTGSVGKLTVPILTASGSGYTSVSTCTVTGGTIGSGGGTGATCTAALGGSGGSQVVITYNANSTYYTSLPTMTTNASGGALANYTLGYTSPLSQGHSFWADPSGVWAFDSSNITIGTSNWARIGPTGVTIPNGGLFLGTGGSFTTELIAATPAANYTLTVPSLTTNDTVMTLGATQTSTGPKTFNGGTTFGGGFVNFNYEADFNQVNNNFKGTGVASAYGALKITGSLFTGGTGTTTFPQVGFIQGATAVSTWSTGGTEIGFNGPSGFTGNFLDAHVNGGASLFIVNNGGQVLADGLGNNVGLTLAYGAAAGTSPPAIACATSHICGWNSGQVNISTGTSPTTGVLFTVTDATTHVQLPNCQYAIYASSSGFPAISAAQATNTLYPTLSTTVQTVNIGTALSASSFYIVIYQCGGA